MGAQAFLRAAGEGDVDGLREVLDAHPDIINECGTLPGNTGQRTALHFGVHHKPVVRLLPEDEHAAADIARLLLTHGADASVTRPNGSTAGHVARARGTERGGDVLTASG
jgi:ankyrin repeat protein